MAGGKDFRMGKRAERHATIQLSSMCDNAVPPMSEMNPAAACDQFLMGDWVNHDSSILLPVGVSTSGPLHKCECRRAQIFPVLEVLRTLNAPLA